VDAVEKLVQLHDAPVASVENLDALYPRGPELIQAPVFTGALVKKLINASKRGDAPGLSGLTVDILRICCYCEVSFADLLATFYNEMLSSGLWPKPFSASRLITIPKSSSPDAVRPIAVSDAITRLFEKGVAAHYRPFLRNAVHPNQVGFMVKDGCAILSRTLSSIVSDAASRKAELHMLQIDIANAFGSAPRCAVFKAAAAVGVDDLTLSCIKRLYDDEVLVAFDKSGPRVVPNHNGVRQGGAWSPELFALVHDVIVRHIEDSDIPRYMIGGSTPAPLIISLADDSTLIAPNSDALTRLWNTFNLRAALINLSVTSSKSKHLHFPEYPLEKELFGVPSSCFGDGFVSVGTPIGSQEFRNSFFHSKAEKTLQLASSVTEHLEPQSALLCTRLCVVSKLTAYLRCFLVDQSVLDDFDSALIFLLLKALDLPIETDHHHLSLPLKDSGLGILSLLESREPAIVASEINRLLEGPFSHLAWSMLIAAPDDYSKLFLAVYSRFGLRLVRENQSIEWVDRAPSKIKIQRDLRMKQLESVRSAFAASLGEYEGMTLKSCACRSASAIFSCLPSASVSLTKNEFRSLLLNRIGSPRLATIAGFFDSEYCPRCRNRLVEGHDRQCPSCVYSLRTQRHNAIVQSLKKMLCQLPGVIVRCEVTKPSEIENRRPDCMVGIPGGPFGMRTFYIDVSIGDLQSRSNRDAALIGRLPDALEKRKSDAYAAWLLDNPGELVPFCFTHVGQIGQRALDFLMIVAKYAKSANVCFDRKFWFARWTCLIAKFTSSMSDLWFKRVSQELSKHCS